MWGPEYGTETNYLRVYMAHIRRKLEPDPAQPRFFITEPGMGYRFEDPFLVSLFWFHPLFLVFFFSNGAPVPLATPSECRRRRSREARPAGVRRAATA